jgi:hypothetical protein
MFGISEGRFSTDLLPEAMMRRRRLILIVMPLGAVPIFSTAADAPSTFPSDLYRFGYDPKPDFVAHAPDYREAHDRFSRELDALQADMIRQQRAGRKTFCTRQVFLECRWLVYYTDDRARTRRRLDELRHVLALDKDPHDLEQDPADGSFAPCCQAWWLRLDMTCDELITMGLRWGEPERPVRLLERINTPDQLRAYLDSLLISDVRRTGINNALELNMAAAADLQRFVLYDGTWKQLPTKFEFHPGLKAALLDYEDDVWQDPRTGMWGAWYRTADGSIVKTADLSTTFHLLSYRQGREAKRWPELIRTTLAMRNGRFPFGWLEEGKRMSNHHNLDVARLWQLAWPHASPEQRAQIAAAIHEMLDFCLKRSLQPDGSFDSPEEDTLSSQFYFGVAFLDEAGYFSKAKRFWTDAPMPGAKQVRDRIRGRILELKLDDSEALWALGILRLAQVE